ncbi:unnamed protein product [Urochloa decumbens]|uniref:chorismate mutase n=1 Tax=Urochloa decumbens TaxID=240449 RepID=A0ABC8VIG5_9POAL
MKQEIIIFHNFLERSQLPLNIENCSSEACTISGFSGSFVEFIMQESEKSHARAGRYKREGELPFFGKMLFEPVLPPLEYSVLHPYAASINLNDVIWDLYFSKILPKLAKTGSDNDKSLCAVSDTKLLQVLSKRVHNSMFLAEAKFRDSPDLYEVAIQQQNVGKLKELLICSEMDERRRRVQERTKFFGESFKAQIELGGKLFDTYLEPLIVEVQVQYLLLKGRDDSSSSRAARKLIRLSALSKTKQGVLRAGPSLEYFAKAVVIFTFAVMVSAKDKILEFLTKKGLVPDKASLAFLVLCFVSAKGAYDTLKQGKEVVDLVKYYAKLLEKDKKQPKL